MKNVLAEYLRPLVLLQLCSILENRAAAVPFLHFCSHCTPQLPKHRITAPLLGLARCFLPSQPPLLAPVFGIDANVGYPLLVFFVFHLLHWQSAQESFCLAVSWCYCSCSPIFFFFPFSFVSDIIVTNLHLVYRVMSFLLFS